MSSDEKPLEWIGRSYAEFMAFPRTTIRKAGRELGFVQEGEEPEDWKPRRRSGPVPARSGCGRTRVAP